MTPKTEALVRPAKVEKLLTTVPEGILKDSVVIFMTGPGAERVTCPYGRGVPVSELSPELTELRPQSADCTPDPSADPQLMASSP